MPKVFRRAFGFSDPAWESLSDLQKQWAVALWLLTVFVLGAYAFWRFGQPHPGYTPTKSMVFAIIAPYMLFRLWLSGRGRR